MLNVTSPTLSDGFALNVGLEDWQVDRVHDCYNAAQGTGLPFSLFISFDMTWVYLIQDRADAVSDLLTNG